jgi:pimeloyl-ACP methyl ester carboxylesterase
VAPLGVQPKIGEIADPFLVNTDRYVEMGFTSTEAYERSTGGNYELGSDSWLRRERNREMTTRIAWRPRMFDQTLPFRLSYITTPTLLVWGEQDVIMPRNGMERYRDAIPNSQLAVIPDGGHMVECEDPRGVGEIVSRFVS